MLEAASEYVRKTLLPALNLGGSQFRLELPGEGLRSLTYFVVVEDGPRLVLRCVRSREDTRWLVAALKIFVERGLPTPRQLHHSTGLWGHWRRGFAAFVEDFVTGKPASPDLTPGELEGLGNAYGRVHATTCNRLGKPHRLESGDAIARRLHWAEKLAAEGESQLPQLAAHWKAEIAALHATRPRPLSTHSLCHNRVTRSNVILRGDCQALLIDLERVKFGSHLQELALLETEVLGSKQLAFSSFLKGYAQTAPDHLLPEAEPAAWTWHRRVIRLKHARDAALAGNFEAARALTSSSR